jgi:hypothetical protein
MEGDNNTNGIIQQSIKTIFDTIKLCESEEEITLKCCCVEI